jgi:hypothetical protein
VLACAELTDTRTTAGLEEEAAALELATAAADDDAEDELAAGRAAHAEEVETLNTEG